MKNFCSSSMIIKLRLPQVLRPLRKAVEVWPLPPKTKQYSDQLSKLVTTIVSTFTAYYVQLWSSFFPDTHLSPPLPSFDGRAVQYPSVQNLKDYMSWRQVDCESHDSMVTWDWWLGGHINNLYNTTFWALIQLGGLDAKTAEKELAVGSLVQCGDFCSHYIQGSLSADKNEILFSRFKINYNNEPEIYKKGSVVFRDVSSSLTSVILLHFLNQH